MTTISTPVRNEQSTQAHSQSVNGPHLSPPPPPPNHSPTAGVPPPPANDHPAVPASEGVSQQPTTGGYSDPLLDPNKVPDGVTPEAWRAIIDKVRAEMVDERTMLLQTQPYLSKDMLEMELKGRERNKIEAALSNAASTPVGLQGDEDYQKLKDDKKLIQDALKQFSSWDATYHEGWLDSGGNNGEINRECILAAANQGDPVAKRLLANPDVLAKIISNGRITPDSIQKALGDTKAEMKSMEAEAKKADRDPGTKTDGDKVGGNDGGDGKDVKDGGDKDVKGGGDTQEGDKADYDLAALENPPKYHPQGDSVEAKTADALDHVQDWVNDLQAAADLALANGNKKDASKLQRKLAEISACQQMLMQMQQQMYTRNSELLKMYGDLAMTAIHNSK